MAFLWEHRTVVSMSEDRHQSSWRLSQIEFPEQIPEGKTPQREKATDTFIGFPLNLCAFKEQYPTRPGQE